MAVIAEKVLLLMSVPKIAVRHICGAGVRAVETSHRPKLKCQVEHNDAFYGDRESRH
jgi:hypothetical protein